MRKNKSPYQVMMEELAADKSLWDRDTHIKGCFADTSMSRNLERQSTLLLRCSGESLSREGTSRKRVSRKISAPQMPPLGPTLRLQCPGFV